MKSRANSGVALVITLIMLSVVTLMAIAFLAISRSQKSAVTVLQDQNDARLVAAAGLARAQAEVVTRMMAVSNRFRYDLMVSTNLNNPAGFRSGLLNPENVSYTYPNGNPLNQQDLLLNLVNLFYNPRPPVFVVTNDTTGQSDFRFYLDFNRNRRFETNGPLPVLNENGAMIRGSAGLVLSNNFVGDPEWVGVLERPERTHSPSNRFVGRYAFLVLPTGKSLDLNYIHNRAKFGNGGGALSFSVSSGDGFRRNQGHGSWELNLASFLVDLNTNFWPSLPSRPGFYHYLPLVGSANAGYAFEDAVSIVRHRYEGSMATLRPLSATVPMLNFFRSDFIDDLPRFVFTDPYQTPLQQEDTDDLWAGKDNPRAFYDVQELFDPTKSWSGFTNRLSTPMSIGLSSYNRYTFYRLLAQLGVDSASAETASAGQSWALATPAGVMPTPAKFQRMNLNYNNLTENPTNFVPWTPLGFFTNAADRMLRSKFFFGVTDIPIYPRNYYTPEVHRLLQLAANIYDATTNGAFAGEAVLDPAPPSVFKPIFRQTNGQIFITGYEAVDTRAKTTTFVSQFRNRSFWRDLSVQTDRENVRAGDFIFGVPVIVGAKKGMPNLNEFALQTVVQATRKLEIVKRDSRRGAVAGNTVTNQAYLLSISNVFGVEAWNAYSQAYNRPLEVFLRVEPNMVLGTTSRSNRTIFLQNRFILDHATNLANWPGGQFKVPMFTNVAFLPNAAFYQSPTPRFVPIGARLTYDLTPGFPIPDWELNITNRVQFLVLDRNANRVLDVVNLDGINSGFNVTLKLMDTGRRVGESAGSSSSWDAAIWITNRVAGVGSPTVGITNQIFVSLFDVLGDDMWRNANADPRAGQEKVKAIEDFRRFMGLPPLDPNAIQAPSLETAKQVPYAPTRKFYQEMRWQANDPLVHYTVSDLSDPVRFTNPENIVTLKPPFVAPTNSNIGLLNERFSPWGGNTNKSEQPDLDYRLEVKDPLVRRSDDWNFPTNRMPSIGWLGRVHRGTPWQTVYLKAPAEEMRLWKQWASAEDTHPTNDWALLELFTVAPNDNAARGLLSVNQTNLAAWSAVLAGVPVLSNSVASNTRLSRFSKPAYEPVFIEPGSSQLKAIVQGVANAQASWPGGTFPTLGSLLSSRVLTVDSPYLRTNLDQRQFAISEEAYERIPQQILSLLKPDEPRVTIYAFGQSLRPAQNSIVVTPGPYRGLCTNYQITGESALKAVIRFEDAPNRPRAVVESYNLLTAEQ